MQKVYEISLITHFEEKADTKNSNKKIANGRLSTKMAGGGQ